MSAKKGSEVYINYSALYLNQPQLQEGEHYISYLLALAQSNAVDYHSIALFFDKIGYFSHRRTFHPERLNDPVDYFKKILSL